MIYGMPGCQMCQKAIQLCNDFDLTYEYKDVTLTVELQREFLTKFPDVKNVPQILWHGNHFKTYNEFSTEVYNTRNYGDSPI